MMWTSTRVLGTTQPCKQVKEEQACQIWEGRESHQVHEPILASEDGLYPLQITTTLAWSIQCNKLMMWSSASCICVSINFSRSPLRRLNKKIIKRKDCRQLVRRTSYLKERVCGRHRLWLCFSYRTQLNYARQHRQMAVRAPSLLALVCKALKKSLNCVCPLGLTSNRRSMISTTIESCTRQKLMVRLTRATWVWTSTWSSFS